MIHTPLVETTKSGKVKKTKPIENKLNESQMNKMKCVTAH